MIKQVLINDDFSILAKLLNDSYLDVTNIFGLTQENCATNNDFVTAEILKSQLTSDREFFYLTSDNKPAGFIAIEESKS